MAECDIFHERLSISHPSCGYALWNPSPRNPNQPVQVGDVGFIRNGKFHRLFNALLPADHPSHEFGVPEYHEPLVPKLSNHLDRGTLARNHYCSAGVNMEADPGYLADPDGINQVTFKCNRKRGGAVLYLPVAARREDTLAKGDFKSWIVKNIDSWFAFARKLGLGIERMEDIILVTGCDLTKSWANIAFFGNQDDSQVSFGVEVKGEDPEITFQFSPENAGGAVFHQGPDGKNLPENQCVFVRGYRVPRSFWILPRRIKALAGPSSDPSGYDRDPAMEVMPIPTTKKQASDRDMVLAHDDDLVKIDGLGRDSSLETLEPDVMTDILRRSNMEIHKVPFVSGTDSGSNMDSDTSVVKEAMLSTESQNWDSDTGPQSQGSPFELRDRLLRWLSPSDPSTNHNIAWSAHHDGTAQWFFQGHIYNQWKSSGSFLWVHGKPGSGKTVLCSSIIQDVIALRNAGQASMAYFYFDYKDVNKQSPPDLLSSLLCQLSVQSDSFCDIPSRLYSAHDRGAQKPSVGSMVECLEEMLTFEAQQPTYIILDALDECSNTSGIPSPREQVLGLVDELVGLHLPNLHICVTSRPEHDIRAVLEHLTPHAVTLHDESGQHQDIANYVTSFVHSNRRMRSWREEDKEFVIKTLSENADAMFRWAVCQLDVLHRCLPPSIRRVLEELPESLDETYERILREISKPNREHARRLLHCLAVAVRPLRVGECAEVLALDFNTEGIPKLKPDWRSEDGEATVMSACSSLVIIVDNGDSRVVRFSHSSVKEYLTSSRLAESSQDISHYHIQLETAHSILAQACLGVLLQFDDRVDRDNISEFPLARYAAQYWAMHAQDADTYSHIKDGVESLFDADKPYFPTWLWIYNEDRGGDSMSTKCPTQPEAVPLYYASRLGFQDLVEHLIAKYPEHVNSEGGKEMTPIHAAASGGKVYILRLLQEHGADVGSRNKYGETPLHGASWSGNLDAGRYLLDLGADVNVRNEDDWTPLFYAVFHGHAEFARMLLERGATTEARSVFSSTALHAAVRGGNVQAVRLLLEHGADVNARDSRGWTPSRWNLTLKQEMIELLAEYGAESGK